MTVLTKVKVSKKEDEPAQTHLVEHKSEDKLEKGLAAAGDGEDEVDADTVRYMVLSQRARRVNGSSICVLTGILLVFSACLLFGLFYYRQSHQSGRLHSWCSVPFQVDQPTLPSSEVEVLFDSPPGAEPRTGPEPIQDMQPIFHEEFDIDFEADTESMFVPNFELGSGARFFNDFKFTQTAIMPEDRDLFPVCLVMELDETMFLRPRPLAERVRLLEQGLDASPLEVTQEKLVIQFPALTPESGRLSPAISRACDGVSIFKLERRDVFKRSTEAEAGTHFAVFGGKSVVRYTITNLSELLKKE
ncbi:uncharacterized protein LOC122393235 isoform X2 [Amphibalanus amphitrite]|uniref:uncharacterized protein LOC122393235 isoform X2 n=1 Tax=Amphibalanus amphitrite TaxID=1232801 RepID=UPI001C8FB1E3|nr:uncharacterized protein LOC122393235 isoform X2 [Amphibalanus amphitrite]XP_043245018.1 uncharacterized protein LOC122393235 isoform X2 [Amphibalanus amphitrite]